MQRKSCLIAFGLCGFFSQTLVDSVLDGKVKFLGKPSLMSRIECKYCLHKTSWQGYMTFSYNFLLNRIACLCFRDFLPMRKVCYAYHKEFESH